MVVVQKATVYKQGLLNISVKNNGKHHKIAKNHTKQTKTGQNTDMQNVGLGRFPSLIIMIIIIITIIMTIII